MPVEIERSAEIGTDHPLLPFAQRECIDASRAMGILGVSYTTLARIALSGLIDWYDHGKTSPKSIRYQSLVDFCDGIRKQHRIPDRRPPLEGGLRYRDEDILPFPLRETVSAPFAADAMGFIRITAVVRLIEEGRFEAYQLVPRARWRISRLSLLAYMDGLRRPRPHPRAYKATTVSPHF